MLCGCPDNSNWLLECHLYVLISCSHGLMKDMNDKLVKSILNGYLLHCCAIHHLESEM